jgi:hypothetical protein
MRLQTLFPTKNTNDTQRLSKFLTSAFYKQLLRNWTSTGNLKLRLSLLTFNNSEIASVVLDLTRKDRDDLLKEAEKEIEKQSPKKPPKK